VSDKKSWKDIDRQRDGRSGRPSGGQRQARGESATANYKRELDAFFDKGVVPAHLKDKLPAGQDKGPSERQQLLRAIRESKGGRGLEKSIDTFLKKFDMPDDPEFWLQALQHSKDPVLANVLTMIQEYLDRGLPLPRKNRFLERLKGLEFTSFDPRVQSRSVALVNRLKGV